MLKEGKGMFASSDQHLYAEIDKEKEGSKKSDRKLSVRTAGLLSIRRY